MPYLTIQTNMATANALIPDLLTKASLTVAEILGKPESYVMVSIPPAMPMIFAGSTEPLAYLELKSIGLSQSVIPDVSKSLCALVEDVLGIAPNRIYIEFSNIARNHWGWDGKTF